MNGWTWFFTMIALLGWIPLVWHDEVGRGLRSFESDPALLEVIADASVHVSTYGTLIVGWLLFKFGFKFDDVLTAILTLVWFSLFNYSAYRVRQVLADLNSRLSAVSRLSSPELP